MGELPTITREEAEFVMELSFISSLILPDELKKVIALRDKLQALIDYHTEYYVSSDYNDDDDYIDDSDYYDDEYD